MDCLLQVVEKTEDVFNDFSGTEPVRVIAQVPSLLMAMCVACYAGVCNEVLIYALPSCALCKRAVCCAVLCCAAGTCRVLCCVMKCRIALFTRVH